MRVVLMSLFALLLWSAIGSAQDVDSIEKTLADWRAACRDRTSFLVSLAVREMDESGMWTADKPWPGRLCFLDSPNRARLDVDRSPTHSLALNSRRQLLQTGQPTQQVDAAGCERANLWIGDMPLFLLVGIDLDLLRYRYQVRVFDSAPMEVSVFLYPQRQEERKRIARIEMRMHATTHAPTMIHVVKVGGAHTYFILEEIQTSARIDPALFEKL